MPSKMVALSDGLCSRITQYANVIHQTNQAIMQQSTLLVSEPNIVEGVIIEIR